MRLVSRIFGVYSFYFSESSCFGESPKKLLAIIGIDNVVNVQKRFRAKMVLICSKKLLAYLMKISVEKRGKRAKLRLETIWKLPLRQLWRSPNLLAKCFSLFSELHSFRMDSESPTRNF